tara:strand:- start:1734 stop:1895 length:162 start_codon:yes stop_codon:yes gene_type:complete
MAAQAVAFAQSMVARSARRIKTEGAMGAVTTPLENLLASSKRWRWQKQLTHSA